MVLHEERMSLLSPMRLPYARPYARHNNVVLRLCPWHNSWQHPLLAGEKNVKGPEGRSVMPHISVMLGSVLLGGFNQRNNGKKFGTFIFLPLLLGFRSCWVRSSGAPLYVQKTLKIMKTNAI